MRGNNSKENISSSNAVLRRSYTPYKSSFFRAGGIEKSNDYGEAHSFFTLADQYLPQEEGRVGRLKGLFCSADLIGLHRWTRANASFPVRGQGYDATPTEIFYDGPEPFIYPVEAWEDVSWGGNYKADGSQDINRLHFFVDENGEMQRKDLSDEEVMDKYWSQGMKVSEYLKKLNDPNLSEEEKEYYRSDDWEVLLDPRFIKRTRNVSLKRLAPQVPDRADELIRDFKDWKRWKSIFAD